MKIDQLPRGCHAEYRAVWAPLQTYLIFVEERRAALAASLSPKAHALYSIAAADKGLCLLVSFAILIEYIKFLFFVICMHFWLIVNQLG